MVRAVFLVVMLSIGVLTPTSGVWMDAAAQETSPVADCPATTEDENQAVIEKQYEAVDAHDLDALVELTTPVVVEHAIDVADAHSADELKANLAAFFVAFPDLQDTIDQVITIDNDVVARVTQSGTQRGDVLGIPATGRHATWTLIGIWRIECGRIAEDWVESDGLAFLEGIGVLQWPAVNDVVASPTAGQTSARPRPAHKLATSGQLAACC